MNAPDVCPFCKESPIVHQHKSPTDAEQSKLKAGSWAQVECASEKCAMRVVKTHRCGSLEEAVRIWNER